MIGEGIGVELERGLSRYRYCNPVKLAASLLRARRLKKQSGYDGLKDIGEKIGAGPTVTLTTIPSRLAKIGPVIRSLTDQDLPPRRITLAIPEQSLREKAPYDRAILNSFPDIVHILSCEDHGPATKLLPALKEFPSEPLVVVDDDIVYPQNFLSNLWDHHQRTPHAVIGYRGVQLENGKPFRKLKHVFATSVRIPKPVDIMFGTWGYLVPPGTFDEKVHDYTGFPDQVRWVDDIWVSGHLARLRVPRLIMPANCFPLELSTSSLASLTGDINRSGENDRIAIQAFRQYWGVDQSAQKKGP